MKPRKAGPSAPVWINGLCYDIDTAAELISLLLGGKVDKRWVTAFAKSGMAMTFNGVRVSGFPPKAKRAAPERRKRDPAEPPAAKPTAETGGLPRVSRPSLLRYPYGESPIDRGAPHAGP